MNVFHSSIVVTLLIDYSLAISHASKAYSNSTIYIYSHR